MQMLHWGGTLKIAPSLYNNGPSTGFVKVNAGSLFTNDNLVLSSEENGTARIAPAAKAGNYIVGKSNCCNDLFLKRRAWRLVTAPINSSYLNYQPGVAGRAYLSQFPRTSELPGMGTHITGNYSVSGNATLAQAAGFDFGVSSAGATASIRVFADNSWYRISSQY